MLVQYHLEVRWRYSNTFRLYDLSTKLSRNHNHNTVACWMYGSSSAPYSGRTPALLSRGSLSAVSARNRSIITALTLGGTVTVQYHLEAVQYDLVAVRHCLNEVQHSLQVVKHSLQEVQRHLQAVQPHCSPTPGRPQSQRVALTGRWEG